MLADAPHTPQHICQMTTEDASIGVQLVDDDELEILEQLGPARMMRKDSRSAPCPGC